MGLDNGNFEIKDLGTSSMPENYASCAGLLNIHEEKKETIIWYYVIEYAYKKS